jgi:hypothetical protein
LRVEKRRELGVLESKDDGQKWRGRMSRFAGKTRSTSITPEGSLAAASTAPTQATRNQLAQEKTCMLTPSKKGKSAVVRGRDRGRDRRRWMAGGGWRAMLRGCYSKKLGSSSAMKKKSTKEGYFCSERVMGK